ncbi:hypothetical protein EW146_g9080 [Bondarzewia mesenterica]|uniref:DUF1742-domain-containing protein n=1 Tax=Bondarzewia mesenterica TaxID=1095465 RepID=A0A4S4L9P1_9AGAM|nr:hypothetical protein EW146_g9080 [Bondarzewia mesenterica]
MSATAFANVYYKRATATPKACWVCYKPTTTVLATANTTDFIYACDTHLTDPTFASQIGESGDAFGPGGANKLGLSAEEIAKVKEEWEERQRLKKEKARAKEKDKDGVNAGDVGEKKDEGKGKDKDVHKDSASSSSTTPKSPSPPLTAKPTPTHQRYSLHRDFFAMRLAEHRRRRQTKQLQELAPRLPGAPRSAIS